jgi:hypothetical protein
MSLEVLSARDFWRHSIERPPCSHGCSSIRTRRKAEPEAEVLYDGERVLADIVSCDSINP